MYAYIVEGESRHGETVVISKRAVQPETDWPGGGGGHILYSTRSFSQRDLAIIKKRLGSRYAKWVKRASNSNFISDGRAYRFGVAQSRLDARARRAVRLPY